MAGVHSGVQAEIKKQQPLALFLHCGAHCLNLTTQAACQSSPLIGDVLQWVHELGTLSKISGKFKATFSAAVAASEGPSASLRPLCPTRWTVRGPAVRAVLSHVYACVLSSLEEMGVNNAKANGLRDRFEKGKTVLGLNLALEVIEALEALNKSLQKRTQTVAGMMSAIGCVRDSLRANRSEAKFREILNKTEEMIDSLGIEPIQVPPQSVTLGQQASTLRQQWSGTGESITS